MPDTQPRITFEQAPDGMHARLLGLWTAENLAEPAHWEALHTALGALPPEWRDAVDASVQHVRAAGGHAIDNQDEARHQAPILSWPSPVPNPSFRLNR